MRFELGEPFRDEPFRVSAARAAGVGEGRLRGDDLARPHHGIRVGVAGSTLKAFALLLRPGERFSHTTAAELWGAPLPKAAEGQIHVTSPSGLTPHHGIGLIGHRGSASDGVARAGFPVSSTLVTFRELAPLLDLDSLVAVGDHFVLDPHVLDPHDLRPYLSLDALRADAAVGRGRGIRRARDAAALVRLGAESPKETELRLLLLRAGLPEPVCGYELLRPNGSAVGWFDLAWPEFRVIAEYDGDQHRTSRAQYERDIRRFDEASDLGWRVIRVRVSGLGPGAARTLSRVTDALRLGGRI